MENLTFTDFQTTVAVILAIFAAITVVEKGVNALKNLFGKGETRMGKIDERVTKVETKLDKDKQRLDMLTNDMEYVLKVMNAMLIHDITGNGVERLKEVEHDLIDYMAGRGKVSDT